MYRLLLLVVTLAVVVESSPARRAEHDDYVVVREIHDHVTKRSDVALPDMLRVEFQRDGKTVRLDLERNKRVNVNVPVTFAGSDKRELVPDLNDVGVYQDVKRGAAISIRATRDIGHHTRKLEGSFGLDNRRYMITPVRDSLAHMMGRLLRRNMVNRPEGVLHHVTRIEEDHGKTKYSLNHADFDGQTRSLHVQVNGRKLNLKVKQMDKRQNADKIASYHVEIVFVLDHTIWEYWMKKHGDKRREALLSIKYFYSNIMNGIDLAYKTIDSVANGIMITPWLKEYYIAKKTRQSPWTVNSISSKGATYRATAIDGDKVISEMQKWVVEGGRYWGNPDHAMLWTKYNLFGDSTVGYAPISTICKYGGGVSVNEDRGFHSWATAAHELGHNLGSYHDGGGQNNCLPSANIMSSVGGTAGADNIGDRFHFSSCSIKYFKDLLSGKTDGYPRVCLTNQVCSHGAPLEGLDNLPGVDFSNKAQCRLKYGASSYYCGWDSDLINVCHIMYCYVPLADGCYGGSPGAADGTTCAPNKRCRQGLCVSKTTNPDPANKVGDSKSCKGSGLPTTVPSGCIDYNVKLTINGVVRNCTGMSLHFPQLCFTWNVAPTYCCAACHKAGLVTPRQHCE
ncbi:hypothetical protein NP493_788g01007 [Ridgeia piscesae]|uniref:Peptidase M12B domain-containing protein n=1 Tax=Ridgeia piscesae TaxID=27915 RepID=A0AAD9KN19_RIDPI|nr:hypothetical protein NP493_788g01007 [Ridgeia piscesae]